ncbi:MAG: type II secretion system F family protein [Alicyclobacillus herbarius]|uniref:type II secretion system F family protein n=1 Tax=Alicyclobacillus herbarius TaxID=122960 RepID=UPI002354BB75|nr:type II secretion system F family protein [Alicyclobacillus herbarius]MCL6631630.1 type II secretion system F family protein [Alicyclobacillus herbarius]
MRKVKWTASVEIRTWLQSCAKRLHYLRRRRYQRCFPELCQDLAELLEAGLPLPDTFACLKEVRSDKLTLHLLDLAEEAVQRGELLRQAWQSFAPPDLLLMLDVGAQSGQLAQCLQMWSEQMRQQREWQSSLMRTSTYPLLLLAVTFLLQGFIARTVLPSLTELYQSVGETQSANDSWALQLLHIIPLLFVCAVAAAVGMIFGAWWLDRYAPPRCRRWIHGLPVGRMFRLQRTGRFAAVLAQLVTAGVPILDALSALELQRRPRWLSPACRGLEQQLLQGQDMASTLGGEWDPVFRAFMTLTESTGNLAAGLEQTAAVLGKRWIRKVETLMHWLEPLLVGVCGSFVAVTMLALMLPMYNLMNTLSTAGMPVR